MKLSKWARSVFRPQRASRKAVAARLTLLGLPLVVAATSLMAMGVKWVPNSVLKPTGLASAVTELPEIQSSLNVSLKPVCSQGSRLGVQASTAPSTEPRLVNFSGDLATIVPEWQTKLTEAPFPQLHARARLAKVPVMMYHDILTPKQVFFDVTPEELEAHFQLIQKNGLTPISLDQLLEHLKTGIPLPPKPIVLTFDDGYQGHYTHVFALMKKYGYPAAFSIYPAKVGTKKGRSSLTWEQLKEMAANPLVTIASHSVTHPKDMRELTDAQLQTEAVESKRVLETQLGISIKHFVYPEGKNDERVQQAIQQAGYQAAWTMSDEENLYAQESDNLLNLARIGQSQIETVIEKADGGPPLSFFGEALNFHAPVQLNKVTVNKVPLILASGGKPVTIHAKSRYQVEEIIANTKAIAAVDGTYFSLEALDSNKLIGPVLSQSTGTFVPGSSNENRLIQGRPLVLINNKTVKFVPFDPTLHNTQEGVGQALPGVTDAFVAGAWLVKDGQPQPAATFRNLYGFDAERDRAFWGVDWADRPVVGVSGDFVNSVALGEALSQAGLRDVVMLDSGASASLVYEGKSMMSYTPRPVPHVVALMPPESIEASCPVANR